MHRRTSTGSFLSTPIAPASRAFMLVAMFAAIVGGCSGPSTNPADGSPDGLDAARTDGADAAATEASDTGGADSGSDAGSDVVRGAACGFGGLIDLARDGVVTGPMTRYVGDNFGTPMTPTIPGDARCNTRVVYEVALIYVMHNAGRLRVSTDNPGTSRAFDTVVWAVNHCRAMNTTALGCNDDASLTDHRSTFVIPQLQVQGAVVYVLIAGASTQVGGASTGTYELTLTELAEVPLGGACDPQQVANVCAAGSYCLGGAGGAVCTADGGRDAPCRTASPWCDFGLSCTGSPYDPGSRCRPTVAAGAACDLQLIDNACPDHSHCMGSGATGMCVEDGTALAHCSVTGAACQPGLLCNDDPYVEFSRCVPIVQPGAACDPGLTMNICAPGSNCIGGGIQGTCILNGARDAQCRGTDPPCDSGLSCNGDPLLMGSQCEPTVQPGGACDPMGITNACVSASHCIATGTAGTCVSDGANGGRCVVSVMPCATGNACNGPRDSVRSRCVAIHADGASCDPSGQLDACLPSSHCVATSATTGVCHADGSNGGFCRTAGAACDAGLGCTTSATHATPLCAPGIPTGSACDPMSLSSTCNSGDQCVGASGAERCVHDGSAGGRCRFSDPVCDAGLGCGIDSASGSSLCIPALGVGAACDSTGASNLCASGLHCVGASASAQCVADGTRGGWCRLTGSSCDASLACGIDATTFETRCVPAVAAGGSCDPSGTSNACLADFHCLPGTGGAVVCLADGTAGARCRSTGLACDAGLGCHADAVSGALVCVSGVAAGNTCDPSGETSVCVTGTHCLGASQSVCVADGTAGGRCRTSNPCDPGLECNGNPFGAEAVCVPIIAVGGGCDPAGVRTSCVAGTHCIGIGASGTCIRDGAQGGQCIPLGVVCDPGGNCLPVGSACDPGLNCNGDTSVSTSRCVP